MPRKKQSAVEQSAVEQSAVEQSAVENGERFVLLESTENEYELQAVMVDGKAIAALKKDKIEIYREEFLTSQTWEGGRIQVIIEPRELAVIKLLEAYHKEVGVLLKDVTTTISRHLIHPHPFNREIYGRYEDSDRPDLKELLDREDSRIVESLTVSPNGLILSGNGRYRATEKNERYLELQVKVEEEMSLDEQALFLVLANQYRPKSEEQTRGELLTMASVVFSGRSVRPKQRGLTANEILNQYAGQDNPVSRQTSYNLATITKGLETIKSPGLRASIKALNDRVSIEKAALIAKASMEPLDETATKLGLFSEEVAAKAAEKMLKGAKGHPTKIIEESLNELKAQKLSQSNPEAISLYEKAIALGDKPSDNRHTPREIIDWASSTMGGIDIDAFATLYQPFYVGATTTTFTIENSFFEGKNTIASGSKIFANPPFSIGTQCCVVFDELLRQGIVSELFLVVPQHILGSASFNQMLRDHNGLVFQPGMRIEFEAGEFLLEWAAKEGKTVGSDANREVTVIVYFGQNRKRFVEEAPLSLKGTALEKFTAKKGEMDIAKLSQKLATWKDKSEFDFYGNKIEINEQEVLVDGERVSLSEQEIAKAIALYAAIMQSYF